MTQATRVFRLQPEAAADLESRLRAELPTETEWRTVPHARFSVKSLGVILTCYTSGKLVLQGTALDTFEARFLEASGVTAATSKKNRSETQQQRDEDLSFTVATIGSDETGKGDYFGPLVVSACFADPEQRFELAEIGVTDSKKLTDPRAMRMAGLIESTVDCETLRVDPVDYNRMHAESGNLNPILAKLHARAIHELVKRNPTASSIVVDRFANERLVNDALLAVGVQNTEVVQTSRAERHPVVAAASIVARAAFLEGLAECSDACGTDLHKGAGAPVDVAARRVLKIGGRPLLETVAKMHFRNTQKVGA